MSLDAREVLARLGAGEPIGAVCAAAGLSEEEFQALWQAETRRRVPEQSGIQETTVGTDVRIDRDRWGIPRISAETDDDLFFGFGYAMAQDRLFQLDYLRRRANGRLSEVLGPDGLELDLTARTIGIGRIAEAEWERTPVETRRLLTAFSGGIDAFIAAAGERLPIEFGLLDYAPEPWSPVDCLAIAGEFRAYLTVRLPVIFIPELGKRVLGDGALYRAFLHGEADDESIVPPGSYPEAPAGSGPVGATIADPAEGAGSNNWVIGGSRSASGMPIVASDPHIAFAAVSCWYEVTLDGGSFNVTGMAYAGMPAVMFGRNRRVAWGITNNICSQRDLYRERTDPTHSGAFLYDGRWEPARERSETIAVRGGEPVTRTIRSSRNGPIVDELLPEAVRATDPVSLRWLGATRCGWLTSLLAMDRASSVDGLRRAVRGWRVPTWSLVLADADGHIGYQVAGEIPVRAVEERGYRPGWDPAHQWQGVIPPEGMPQLGDPERGWIASANNRTAPEDFPRSLSGRWASGYRARRIRQMLEAHGRHSRDDCAHMHQDVLSLRAVTCVPPLLRAVAGHADHRIRQAAERLADWDCRMETDRVGAAIFEVFFGHWSARVAAERFAEDPAGARCRCRRGSCHRAPERRRGPLVRGRPARSGDRLRHDGGTGRAHRAPGREHERVVLGPSPPDPPAPRALTARRPGLVARPRRPAGERQRHHRLQHRLRSQLGGGDGRQLPHDRRFRRRTGRPLGGRRAGAIGTPRQRALLRSARRVARGTLPLSPARSIHGRAAGGEHAAAHAARVTAPP